MENHGGPRSRRFPSSRGTSNSVAHRGSPFCLRAEIQRIMRHRQLMIPRGFARPVVHPIPLQLGASGIDKLIIVVEYKLKKAGDVFGHPAIIQNTPNRSDTFAWQDFPCPTCPLSHPRPAVLRRDWRRPRADTGSAGARARSPGHRIAGHPASRRPRTASTRRHHASHAGTSRPNAALHRHRRQHRLARRQGRDAGGRRRHRLPARWRRQAHPAPSPSCCNGGPGMASGWLQVGALGPWRMPCCTTIPASPRLHPSQSPTPRPGSTSPTWCSSIRPTPAIRACSTTNERAQACSRSTATSARWPQRSAAGSTGSTGFRLPEISCSARAMAASVPAAGARPGVGAGRWRRRPGAGVAALDIAGRERRLRPVLPGLDRLPSRRRRRARCTGR